MKLANIISEIEFFTYSAIVRVEHEDSSPTEIAELLRALPGVTTVAIAGSTGDGKRETFKIKLITQKTGEEAFNAFKSNALDKYTPIKVVKIGTNTIEKK
jgi:hypothetical protein